MGRLLIHFGCMTPLCVLALACGCQKLHRAPTARDQTIRPIVTVRDVRVLLADRHARCRVRTEGGLLVEDDRGRVRFHGAAGEWVDFGVDGHRQVRCADAVLGPGTFDVRAEDGGAVELVLPKGSRWGGRRRYAGSLRLRVHGDQRLRVINHVDLETYVACVLPGEIFPDFERQAYRAQVVAARTYVLFQMARRADRAFDVSATEASQVYPGLAAGATARKARDAADATRGIVATWTAPTGEQIFCTFYSSCCGGRTQNVANCRRDVPSIPPLAGGVRCHCSRVAKGQTYQWKPVRLSKSDITAKLVARYPKLKDLGRIDSMTVVARTPWGRPKVFRLRGRRGRSRDIIAEDFRLAVGSRALRSTNFRIENRAEDIAFRDGRGFGHGMGMCQWGMQEMALRGFSAGDILKHYYPTMHLTRAY